MRRNWTMNLETGFVMHKDAKRGLND
jgi:hypothetical protein